VDRRYAPGIAVSVPFSILEKEFPHHHAIAREVLFEITDVFEALRTKNCRQNLGDLY
jgi:hypothetical protein